MTTWMRSIATVAVAGAIISGSGAEARNKAADRVTVRGQATLDGAPFDAPYLGAVVRKHGLVTPCQRALPRVRAGLFTIPVSARTESLGCGTSGSEILLWTFVHDQIVYSAQSAPWPRKGHTVRFDPTFSAAAPSGAVGPIVGFAGEVHQGNVVLPPGARVEAFIGTTRCAVATTRTIGDFTGFSIDVVGPDSIPGCVIGGTITFKVNGRVAIQTALNQQGQSASMNLNVTVS
jgi:hypothetical protein